MDKYTIRSVSKFLFDVTISGIYNRHGMRYLFACGRTRNQFSEATRTFFVKQNDE